MFGAFERGLERRFTEFDVAGNVFDHDDSVVDDEAGGDRKRHEGKIVQAEIKQIHDAEGADDGERNGDAGNDCGADAAEE